MVYHITFVNANWMNKIQMTDGWSFIKLIYLFVVMKIAQTTFFHIKITHVMECKKIG